MTERIARLFSALQEAVETETVFSAGAWAPAVDLCETPDRICVRVELPGVTLEQIKVGLTSTRLYVRGDKKRRKSRQPIVSHLRSERSFGRFSRTIRLRWPIRVSEATAELSNGVLVIYLPKIKDRRGAEFRVPIKER
jgi:HSP20 family protein